ncbi:hypothetical protein [Oceaniglobus roseus]|uniref:hypothetical protein n=1 Tax=Oceaniglobus roseus TaxID=1737570 RepID=UPI000C7F4959|nr:hypothetical protein [Kandeliimicrobium roseum]
MTPEVPRHSGDRSVLIFEPQFVIANDLAESLCEIQSDLDIVVVTSKEQAGAVLDAHGPFFMAIVPQNLVKQDDRNLLARMRAAIPHVVLHGDDAPEDQLDALPFLEAPFTSETVHRMFRRVTSV